MKFLIALCSAALAVSSFSVTWAVPRYRIVPLGFSDAEHTDSNGSRVSRVVDLNEMGQVLGNSWRYSSGNSDLGQSVWIYNSTATINIGLTGPEHTRSDGNKYSSAIQLNEAGQVVGYSGLADRSGYTSWLYNGSTTIEIGLTGIEPSPNDEQNPRTARVKDSLPSQLNEAGQVIGSLLDGANGGSRSAWLYNGTTTIDIGLHDIEHTRINGYQMSVADYLTESGRVIGRSYRYNGGTDELGYTAWLYDGTKTIDIGLTDAEHTRNDGYKFSTSVYAHPSTHPDHLNEAGQVLGISWRFDGNGANFGQSTWLYNGTTTINIGLTGAEHTNSVGGKYSEARQLNEAGQVIGYSASGESSGYTAWLYNGTTSIDIGLDDIEHTNKNGHDSSSPFQLNEAGQVIGGSRRYDSDGANLGHSAWLYNGTTTTNIGLTGAENTRDDGYRYSFVTQLNEAGQAVGFSERYNGGSTKLGADAWFYDPVLDQTFSLQLSTRSDGYANSTVSYFGEDGLVLGYYRLFDALDNDLGYRPFYFSVADGLHDLGSLVGDGLAVNGWDYLPYDSEIHANGRGQIIGRGALAAQAGNEIAYLLMPVPEPSALYLAAFGVVALLARRRF